MNNISLIYNPSFKDKDYANSEVYGGLIKRGTTLVSKENSGQYLREIAEEIIKQKDVSKENPLLLRFLINTTQRWSGQTVRPGLYINRYVLTSEMPFIHLKDNLIDFNHSLIFPFGKDAQTIEGNLILGPRVPEIDAFKIYVGKEREDRIQRIIRKEKVNKNKLTNFLIL